MSCFSGYTFTLASKSPRRKELLEQLGIAFTVEVGKDEKEAFSPNLPHIEVPEFLAKHKSESFHRPLHEKEILITADTLVFAPSPDYAADSIADKINHSEVLGKPVNRENAIEMITKLSGVTHYVLTGVAIRSLGKTHSFTAVSEVTFRRMIRSEIEYYVDRYQPYDKAGAYGVQEWIGFAAITSIKGSYCNVVGLPVDMLAAELPSVCK